MLSEYPQCPRPIYEFRSQNYVYTLKNQASSWQINSWIGDSLWNKVSAEFGLYAPKWSSSFLLVFNGHTIGQWALDNALYINIKNSAE